MIQSLFLWSSLAAFLIKDETYIPNLSDWLRNCTSYCTIQYQSDWNVPYWRSNSWTNMLQISMISMFAHLSVYQQFSEIDHLKMTNLCYQSPMQWIYVQNSLTWKNSWIELYVRACCQKAIFSKTLACVFFCCLFMYRNSTKNLKNLGQRSHDFYIAKSACFQVPKNGTSSAQI